MSGRRARLRKLQKPYEQKYNAGNTYYRTVRFSRAVHRAYRSIILRRSKTCK